MRAAHLVAAGAVAVAVSACAEPEPLSEPGPEPTITEDPVDEPGDRDELRGQLDELVALLAAVREELAASAEASSLAAAQAGADRALGLLILDPGAGRAGDDTVGEPEEQGDEAAVPASHAPVLLPSETVERSDSATTGDLLNATLTLAGDLGGELGRDVADVLRDPIAGDLGAWQRDPAGMVGLAAETAQTSDDIAALERAIMGLEGEGTRALAWTFVVTEATELAVARDAAERALAHVELMLFAVEDVGGTP